MANNNCLKKYKRSKPPMNQEIGVPPALDRLMAGWEPWLSGRSDSLEVTGASAKASLVQSLDRLDRDRYVRLPAPTGSSTRLISWYSFSALT